MRFFWLLVILYLLAGGVQRLLWPGRCLRRRMHKPSGPSEQAVPDLPIAPPDMSNRLRTIRCFGVLRIAVVLIGLWVAGVSVGWENTVSVAAVEGGQVKCRGAVQTSSERFLRNCKASALAVGAVCGTNRVLLLLGKTGLWRSPVGPDTLFEIGSITKVFTGIALAREVDSGSLEMDEKVQTLIGPDVQLPPGGDKITLGHLTTHTSGLPRIPSNMSPLGGLKMVFLGGDPYGSYSESDFLEGLRSAKLHSKPGEHSEYSNFGTGLLGWALAKHAGLTYEDYILRSVCLPLGMDNTRVELSASQRSRLAQGYRWIQKWGPVVLALRSAPWNLRNHFAGAGGLRSTGVDMLKFLAVNMNPADSSLADALKTAQEERFRENEYSAVAMNWIRFRYSWSKEPVLWHNGGTGGFRSYLGFLADGQAGVVVLSNSAESVDGLGLEILQTLIRHQAAGDL